MRALIFIGLLICICSCSGKINNLNIFGYQTEVPATMDGNAKEDLKIQEKEKPKESLNNKGGRLINAIKKLEEK
ncbi:hypothetical protein D3C84_1094740 [compost metagenome]